jgi:hypothetical protein
MYFEKVLRVSTSFSTLCPHPFLLFVTLRWILSHLVTENSSPEASVHFVFHLFGCDLCRGHHNTAV